MRWGFKSSFTPSIRGAGGGGGIEVVLTSVLEVFPILQSPST